MPARRRPAKRSRSETATRCFRRYRAASRSRKRRVTSVASGRWPNRRFARSCYDHLAGRLGVAVAEEAEARGYLVVPDRASKRYAITSRRLNSCLLIDNTATAHLPGPQNPGMCHLYLAEGCHLYIALTVKSRRRSLMTNSRLYRVKHGRAFAFRG
jgi:hypothetical protein